MRDKPSFLGIPPEPRIRVYHYLLTVTAARLPWRPALRYGKFGFPIDVLVINHLVNREATKFIVSTNTFNVIVGHNIVPDTIISPLSYGRFTTPPNFNWIHRLHLTIEVDLDDLFTSPLPDNLLPTRKDEPIFERMKTFHSLIRAMNMPNLKAIILSIYEIVDPKKRIHVACDINEREVRGRYAEIVRPLQDLRLPQGLFLEDVDIVYGDGYTLGGADPEDWWRADDYIMLFKQVLHYFGCHEGPQAALGALQRNSAALLDGKLTARSVFGDMNPTHPLEAPPILPPPAKDPLPVATPSHDPKQKRPNSLRKYWEEGTNFVVQPRKSAKDKMPPDSPESSRSEPSTSADVQGKKASKGAGSSGHRSSSGKSSLSRYWEEGASYTLDSFVQFSRGRRGSAGSKGHRWSIV